MCVGDADSVIPVIKKVFDGWTSQTPYARIDNTYVDVAPKLININKPDKENGGLSGAYEFECK